MVDGFHDVRDFKPVIGWELYQITLDKLHVMFYFEDGWQLLNVAYRFSHRSQDGTINYTCDVADYGQPMQLNRLLREKILEVKIYSERELSLRFSNSDELIVYDNPLSRSWWFIPVADPDFPEKAKAWSKWDDFGVKD